MSLNNSADLSRAATEARGLAMDAVAACHSGHLGLPLGAAEIGAVLNIGDSSERRGADLNLAQHEGLARRRGAAVARAPAVRDRSAVAAGAGAVGLRTAAQGQRPE